MRRRDCHSRSNSSLAASRLAEARGLKGSVLLGNFIANTAAAHCTGDGGESLAFTTANLAAQRTAHQGTHTDNDDAVFLGASGCGLCSGAGIACYLCGGLLRCWLLARSLLHGSICGWVRNIRWGTDGRAIGHLGIRGGKNAGNGSGAQQAHRNH